ncbi:MAG: class I SAM-dependent methyltransferase [Anaerolineae bacterium]|nr:class I SAM-dependent methyltransferase [Anaerolineae bacterium]
MLAKLYHAHHIEYVEDLPFWLELARQQGGPVLELGCVTGRVTLELARAGNAVYGLDNDAAMLGVLKEAMATVKKVNVQAVEGDMTNFDLGMKFPLILLPCNTYSTLDAGQRQATLGCVRQHLAPGGLFAASVPNPALLASLPEESEAEIESVFEHPESGNPVQVSSAWRREAESVLAIWHYDQLLPDGRVARETASTLHRTATVENHMAEFAQANLNWMTPYGDFEKNHFEDEMPYLIIMASAK